MGNVIPISKNEAEEPTVITNKANRQDFHTIAPGDRIEIWWHSAGRHVWVTALAVELDTATDHAGAQYVTGATFTVYNPHSYVYEANGSQKQVKRVAVLRARRYSDDVKLAYTPDSPTLTADQATALLAYHQANGGPERNCVIPEDVVARAQG